MSFADNLVMTAAQLVDKRAIQAGERQHSLASRLTIMVFGACFGTVLLACGIAYLAMERTLYHAEDQVLRRS